MMEYEYGSFRKESDYHNRCCGGMLWCIRDICGIICAILTWLLILYAEFVVMTVILIPSPYPVYSVINMIVFQICAFLAVTSHVKTMFTDPVSKYQNRDESFSASSSFESNEFISSLKITWSHNTETDIIFL